MSRLFMVLTFGLLFAASSHAQEKHSLEQKLLAEGAEALAKAAREQGDARRGAVLFHRPTIGCVKCHGSGASASSLGPDLTRLDKKTTAGHLVESILLPSKVIRQEFRATVIVTDKGQTFAGMLVAERPDVVELRDPVKPEQIIRIPRKEIDEQKPSPVSIMPVGQVNQLADRGQFLDLARYVIEIAEQGAERARQLQPDPSELVVAVEDIDHAAQIRALAKADLKKGQELYTQQCVTCHGKDGNKTLNPLARRFAKDPLKYGTDPYAMWKTISYGNGLMLPQAGLMPAAERYLVVNYIREQLIKQPNPSQYHMPNDTYLSSINAIAAADAKQFGGPVMGPVAAGMIPGDKGAKMDYGPYLAHSVAFTNPKDRNATRFPDTTERALIVSLPGENVVCYDTDRCSIAGIWRGSLAKTAGTHHTSYKGGSCLTPGGAVVYSNTDDSGWAVGELANTATEAILKFKGHHLHGNQVLLSFAVGDRRVEELPSALPGKTVTMVRTLRVSPGKLPLFCQIARLSGGQAVIYNSFAALKGSKSELRVALSGQADGLSFISDKKGGLWLSIPDSAGERVLNVWTSYGAPLSGPSSFSPIPEGVIDVTPDLGAITRGGPRRWTQTVRTPIVAGMPIEGYAADEMTLPYANPWGSWMRTTAIDFFPDGRAAVATLSGDVLIASWSSSPVSPLPLGERGNGVGEITWSRFATGLYEPLGLRIVNNAVHIRGRDRITRLHDMNSDGEADYYENFFQEGEIGTNYHAFIFELQTDRAGNFYYAKSGRKTPHEGAVIRISPDGSRSEVVCRDFRHPNGMGAGGPHDWVTVSDNPDGKAVYNGVALVQEGGTYGYAASRTTPMLAVLPPALDSSSGGQCWSDPDWGPLGQQMIHTSYSRCRAFYILTQNVAPHPNGFAVPFPFALKSGVMRVRTNPVDKQVYMVGQKGWDTTARYDGCFYRIRHAKEPSHLIIGAAATTAGLELTFSCDLEPASIMQSNVEVVREEGKGVKPIRYDGIRLIDKRAIEIRLPDMAKEVVAERSRKVSKTGQAFIDVISPIRVTTKFRAADGAEIKQVLYATVNSLRNSQ